MTKWRRKSTNKFNAQPKVYNGVRYDSTKEANRAKELDLMQRVGMVQNIRNQVKFVLLDKQKKPGGGYERPVTYRADFVYKDKTGAMVVEDVKSEATRKKRDYVICRKLMLWVHGIEVVEV